MAVASLFFPGLGQFLQKRIKTALLHLVLAIVLWVVTFGFLGWLMNIFSAYSAFKWDGQGAGS
jgi:TM2 domain-containing membrane protein YozV